MVVASCPASNLCMTSMTTPLPMRLRKGAVNPLFIELEVFIVFLKGYQFLGSYELPTP